MSKKPFVILLLRRHCGGFSIEKVFHHLLPYFDAVDAVEREVPETGATGSAFRKNCSWVRKLPKDAIVHITGDIHYCIFGLLRRKTVLTVHDLVPLTRGGWMKRWLVWLIWYQLPAWSASRVVCISETTRKRLLHTVFCNPKKVRVIHDPLPDGLPFTPAAFREDKPVILQIGTKPNKNLPRLVEALRGLRCRLRIVGALSQEQKNLLDASGVEYSQVMNLTSEELFQEYVRCDILCFVSLYEGFGMPLIEAQAVGRPVVTSNLEPLTEIAAPGSAFFVDPTDPEAIRRGVVALMTDPELRAAQIAAGLENTGRFRIQHIAGLYQNVYLELSSHE